ncbi:MAG: carbamoyl phosphate synthase small subunit [Oscillospiraceae bacterium]|jgi:carbamoyl-phosphate synthase small subunit|nr:carbamoyl phosphate synthase small subunit [Oscillospiraceae bacterium]
MKAYLILENGMEFEGVSFGARGDATGEVVFATGMSGYLETLTDPSYYGQIVLQTFPLIGNYGVIPPDFESSLIGAKAYIVKHPCQEPSNYRSEGALDAFLKERCVVGLCGIDTRALTRIIRANGVMNGKITASPPTDADLAEAKAYAIQNAVAAVSRCGAALPAPARQHISETVSPFPPRRRVALMDFGAKRGIADALASRDCEVRLFPYGAPARDILQSDPDGVMLSNGPGDPAAPENGGIVETLRILQQSGVPIFGICLGHQLLALANGYPTQKLKFGHRGVNQPVRETATGRVYITSQNHGYAVVAEGASFVNVNDGTCEGMDYGVSFSVQFHPEARGGPLDTAFLFDRFIGRMAAYRR